jgi:AGCS family alanine or glycine:cation symporter
MSWFYFVPPFLSVTLSVNIIWTLADMAVGFIILPNMVALILLNKEFSRLWKSYVDNMKMLSKNTMLN